MDYCGPRGIALSRFLSWPADDQAAALLWATESQARCPDCGTREWEWEADPEAYEPTVSVCRGCMALAQVRRDHEEHTARIPGVHFGLRRGVSGGES